MRRSRRLQGQEPEEEAVIGEAEEQEPNEDEESEEESEEDEEQEETESNESEEPEADEDKETKSDSESTVKLPTFNGDASRFQMWWTQFQAYAALNKFIEAVQKTRDPNLPATESTVIDDLTDEGKKQASAVKKNAKAFASLAMAFTSERLLGLLTKAKTKEWPNGLACLVIKGMLIRYQPKDRMSRVELRRQLNQVTMKKDEDPSTLFEQIAKKK